MVVDVFGFGFVVVIVCVCLLYTSDAADERSSVDLGGRRIIKKKKKTEVDVELCTCGIVDKNIEN